MMTCKKSLPALPRKTSMNMKTSVLVTGPLLATAFVATALSPPALAAPAVKVTVEHAKSVAEANTFATITPASNADAGNLATYRLLEGRRDPDSAEVEVLNDGQLPANADEPRSNFFLMGPGPSRLLIELAEPCSLQQIRTYSRHPAGRGPQRYSVYVRQSAQPEQPQQLEAAPDAANSDWQLLAAVDTRSAGHNDATTAAALTPADPKPAATLGKHRYLLMVIEKGETNDPFGNTFYSEIDLDDGREHAPPPLPEGRSVLVIDDGKYQIEFDTTATPKLTAWVERVLKPACAEWYPRIVEEFPTDGYQAPQQFKIVFEAGTDGVAYTMGTRVVCSEPWFANNLAGEAAGAVVHELVHVVQQFTGRPQRAPGWLVEGLADYVRWFQYEPPQNRPRVDFARARHTDSYRTTGAFIDYLARSYDDKLPAQLNDICRRGEYTDSAWKELTGKTIEELWRRICPIGPSSGNENGRAADLEQSHLRRLVCRSGGRHLRR